MAYPSRARARSRARVVPILLLPLLAVAACDDKKTPANLNEYVSRLAALICKYNVACAGTPDMASCMASTLQDSAEIAAVEADIASGTTKYDAAMANACLEWFEHYTSAGCTQSGLAAVGLEGEAACAGVLVGTVAPGGACSISTECANSGLCQPTEPTCAQQCCPGTCLAPAAPIPVGGDCSTLQPNQSCATGSFCLPVTGGTPTCFVQLTVEGSSCASIYACASPLFCDMPSSTGTGTCRRLAASGAACNSIVASYLSCDDIRDTCDAATNTCVRRTAVGGTCDAARSPCVAYALCQLGTCVAYTKPGAACTPGATPDCLGSLECSAQTNTCVAPSSDGSCI
jgi:hypothetical protein